MQRSHGDAPTLCKSSWTFGQTGCGHAESSVQPVRVPACRDVIWSGSDITFPNDRAACSCTEVHKAFNIRGASKIIGAVESCPLTHSKAWACRCLSDVSGCHTSPTPLVLVRKKSIPRSGWRSNNVCTTCTCPFSLAQRRAFANRHHLRRPRRSQANISHPALLAC